MITKKQDRTLEVVGTLLPIIFAFIIGAFLTAKLFNMEVKFDLADYVIIGTGLFSIFFGVREQIKNQIELRKINSKEEENK